MSAQAEPAPPLVSLFVLAYSQEEHVRAAIAGAFAQTYSPLEIILSDDNSPDRTFAIMEEMAAAYDGPHRIVLNRNPINLGLIGHINRVMELASGGLVVQNAGDDISHPERVAELAAVWRAGEGRIMAVHSVLEQLEDDGTLTPFVRLSPPLQGVTPRQFIEEPRHLIGASMAWTPDLFEVFGPLGAAPLVEDRPIAFRASLIGEIAWVDRPLLQYRRGGASDPDKATGRPEDVGGLYGYHLMRRRWRRSFLQSYLADMETVAPPDADACREICRREIARLDFEIGLAERGMLGRIGALPQALALSARLGSAAPLAAAIKYLLAVPYRVYRGMRRPKAVG